MGWQEELGLYREPRCDSINPQVTQVMTNLGFKEEQIEEAIRSNKYNMAVAMYLIPSHNAPNGRCRAITGRPRLPQSLPPAAAALPDPQHSAIRSEGQRASQSPSQPGVEDHHSQTWTRAEDRHPQPGTPVQPLGLPLHP